MAIKAGRVGVAPDQVDEFGNINSEATSGYTKQEADAKFETQSHAASTYETKSDAAALQPKTLAVPIDLLSGTALTVESALQGLSGDKYDNAIAKVLGAKNMLPYPFTDTTKESNGITFTDNGDGTVTANGTASGLAVFQVFGSAVYSIDKDIIINGCPAGGSSGTYEIILYDETTQTAYYDYGEGVLVPSTVKGHNVNVNCRIRSGQAVSGLVFKPMWRYYLDNDPEYVPYAMTNRQITEWILSQS